MSYQLDAFLNGAGKFVLAFGLGLIFIAVFKWLYQMVTPYNERNLIASNNQAAAITLGGALVGFALPVASALEQTGDILEFAMWAVLAGVVQIVAFVVVRRFIVKDLKGQVESGNSAMAIYLAATSIAVGLINAASMTY